MRKNLRFFASLMAMMLAVGGITAQTPMPPQLFTYQAVVRDGANHIVRNSAVGVKITIMQTDPNTGTQVYQETHTPTTNVNGAFTVIVGNGTNTTGTIAAINWSNGPYYLVSQVDINNDLAYDITTTQQLVSVPYALYCGTCANGGGGGSQGLSDVVAVNNSANNNQLKNLKDPTDPQDAMTKRIIDSITHRYDSILAALTACCGGGGGGSTPCAASAGTVNISGTAAICSGATTTLTASATGNRGTLTYQWKKDGVDLPGETNATYTASTAGNYTVVVTATDGTCTPTSATANASLNVTSDASNLTIGAINVDQGSGATPMTSLTVTAGDEADVSANVLTSSAGGRLGYAWGSTRGDNAWCQTSGRHFTAGDPGASSQTMTLYLRVFDTTVSGCTSYKDTTLQITINPAAQSCPLNESNTVLRFGSTTGEAVTALEGDPGDNAKLYWSTTGDYTPDSYTNGGVTWSVSPSTGVTKTDGYKYSNFTFADAGTYTVTATMNYNSGCTMTNTCTITIVAPSCPSSNDDVTITYTKSDMTATINGIAADYSGWTFAWYYLQGGTGSIPAQPNVSLSQYKFVRNCVGCYTNDYSWNSSTGIGIPTGQTSVRLLCAITMTGTCSGTIYPRLMNVTAR